MSKFIRRLLSLLFRLKIYDKHFKLTHEGRIISWNILYSQNHWTKRNALQKDYHKIFTILTKQAKVKKMDEMTILAFYNSKSDVDNVTIMCKWLADVLKESKIEEDDTRFYKGIMVFFDPSLKKNSMEFHILGK